MIKQFVFALSTALLCQSAFAGTISCSADMMSFGSGPRMKIDVTIDISSREATTASKLPDGRQDKINYKNVLVKGPYDIRANVGSIDPYAGGNVNEGEMRIAHALSLLEEDEIRDQVAMSFDLKQVKKVMVYDIDEKSRDEAFGGFNLVEAYGTNNKFLGRFISSMLIGECK